MAAAADAAALLHASGSTRCCSTCLLPFRTI
jgi:hypothetical protein